MSKIKVVLLLLLTLVISSSFVACQQEGKSAYEIAVDNGFTGTELEWLESLKGSDGTKITVEELYEYYLIYNEDASFEDFLGFYLSSGLTYDEFIANKALCSAVSISAMFEKTVRTSPFGSSTTQTYYSGGAGVIYEIVEASGIAYIVTNYHVIYDIDSNGANGISIDIDVYQYGREYLDYKIDASYVGGSMDNDIAVLEVDSNDLADFTVAVSFADSNNISAGDLAIAIGNPEASGISVTSGVVSVDSEYIAMKQLNNPNSTIDMRVIRIDTPVNSGNSGGGLFDKNGELIGIVNAKTSDTSIENIGYAIPSNIVNYLVRNIIESTGYKATLGISVALHNSKGVYDSTSGKIQIVEEVKVSSVSATGTAYGLLKENDILLSVTHNSNTILLTRTFILSEYLLNVRENEAITLHILRDGYYQDIFVTFNADSFIQIN